MVIYGDSWGFDGGFDGIDIMGIYPVVNRQKAIGFSHEKWGFPIFLLVSMDCIKGNMTGNTHIFMGKSMGEPLWFPVKTYR